MTDSNERRPNILLIAIDSLRADHMSAYGYQRLTTPYMDEFAQEGVLFENTFSPHIPTTPAYASMLTGRDCFGTNIVALRHKGGLNENTRTLPEILRDYGYNSTCVGFDGNPANRGFDNYLSFPGWGSWETRPSTKAANLNNVTVPEIQRLQAEGKPWMMMLRHMDPHSPYLPPSPYDRMFYHGNECDPANDSMKPVLDFAPFADYFKTWFPPGVTDRHFIDAQYDGAVAYMDACIQVLFNQLDTMGILDDTIVIINGDHGETLYEHQCWYDHHGMYDNCLHVPLIIRYPKYLPAGVRISGFNLHQDLVPTILELADLEPADKFDGRSLTTLISGQDASFASEFYITECTWMHKHGWRTPEWKLILALEPDFHFMPPVELYNLISDPEELHNVAEKNPDVVKLLTDRMEAFIAKREKETGTTNPIKNQPGWHGNASVTGDFKTSQEAYDTLHIGSVKAATKLQDKTGDKK